MPTISPVCAEQFRVSGAESCRAPLREKWGSTTLISMVVRRRASRNSKMEKIMAWTTPTLVEICIGLEINGYLPAEF